MKRNTSQMNTLIHQVGRCELCGSKRGLEAHHIVPLIFGGPDTEDNLLVVCCSCHAKLTPRKLLTKQGLKNAKDNGKQLGQPKGVKLVTKKSISAKKLILEKSYDFNGTMSDPEVIKLTGLARGTFYKYKKELREGVM